MSIPIVGNSGSPVSRARTAAQVYSASQGYAFQLHLELWQLARDDQASGCSYTSLRLAIPTAPLRMAKPVRIRY